MSSTVKDRLIEFIKWNSDKLKSEGKKSMGRSKFEEYVGLSSGLVSKIGENITRPTMDKIKARFPDLNTDWLDTGHGSMLLSDTPPAADLAKEEFHKIVDKWFTLEQMEQRLTAVEKRVEVLVINSAAHSQTQTEDSGSEGKSNTANGERKVSRPPASRNKEADDHSKRPGKKDEEGKTRKD